jgi:ketosteroid isomerase-like protein
MSKKEKALLAKNIDMMMAEVSANAERVDVDKTFRYISRGKDAVYFMNDKKYDAETLLKEFAGIFGGLKYQKLIFNYKHVIVLGPDAAVWTASGIGTSESQDGTKYVETLTETWLWQKISGRWVVTHYHESTGRI